MKILFLQLILLVSTSAYAQEEAVFTSEQQRWEAQINRDVDALEILLGEELHYIHSNTLIENKVDFIKSVESAKIIYQAMNLKQHELKQYKKIAVITGLVEVVGLYKGTEFTVELFYTSIYRKQKRKWILINWQSTSKKKS